MIETKKLRELSCNLEADPDDYIRAFRKNLFMYLSQQGVTLAEVAELADIPLSTLRTFLYGDAKDCRISTAVKLARAFHVSVDELLGSGTISEQTCESLQLMRQLPESFTHFVRWAIHYHYDKLYSKKVTERAIEIMYAECRDNGNLGMTNNFDVMDISNLNDEVRPKIFMGIRIPCDHFMPLYSEGDILLIANDRNPRPHEHCIASVGDNMWLLKRKEEIVYGEKKVCYYSIRDDHFITEDKNVHLYIGYVAKVVHPDDFEK